uniref:Interleukin family protein n=1 Tax=Hucho hucho TaxID=62062 RepID=A0A4W5PU53_9TELE
MGETGINLQMLQCEHAQCSRVTCSDRCCSFVEGFPVRLKELRTAFSTIRDYYEANDELETPLLDKGILHHIKSPLGCHAMDSILKFYLNTVLPTAMNNNNGSQNFKSPIYSIGNIFHELKKDIVQCVCSLSNIVWSYIVQYSLVLYSPI